jgi:PAS domain S-box-containing protein
MPETLPVQLYQQIIDQAPDAVLVSDRDGRIRLWNRGAELVFGYTAAEALGQSLDLIIPERLQGRHWDGYHRVMATGESQYGTKLLSVPALHRDGRQISCAFSIVMLKDEQGQLLGIASIMRDATAGWQKEQDLKAQITELKGQLAQ